MKFKNIESSNKAKMRRAPSRFNNYLKRRRIWTKGFSRSNKSSSKGKFQLPQADHQRIELEWAVSPLLRAQWCRQRQISSKHHPLWGTGHPQNPDLAQTRKTQGVPNTCNLLWMTHTLLLLNTNLQPQSLSWSPASSENLILALNRQECWQGSRNQIWSYRCSKTKQMKRLSAATTK